jgi:hypothetical protein
MPLLTISAWLPFIFLCVRATDRARACCRARTSGIIDGTDMRIARTILALLISLSVAILPAAGGAVALTASAPDVAAPQALQVDAAEAASEPMAMAEPMDDCCDHGTMPCDQGKTCASVLMCAMHCFNFTTVEAAVIIFPLTVAAKVLRPAESAVPSRIGAPPFRPPRA